jgi:hypothetical protein
LQLSAWEPKEDDAGMGELLVEDQLAEIAVGDHQNPSFLPGDGLAAAGEARVARALEILRADVERTLKLLGCPSVAALDRSYVEVSANGRRVDA